MKAGTPFIPALKFIRESRNQSRNTLVIEILDKEEKPARPN